MRIVSSAVAAFLFATVAWSSGPVATLPLRVVTLAPSLGELAADLLGEQLDRIVGVSDYTDYPPSLKKLPSVGPYPKVNLEKVVSLKPDLVLATADGNSRDQVRHLRELGIPVVVVATASAKEVLDSIRTIGTALGRAAEGARLAAQLETGLAHVRERSRGRPPLRVMLQIGADPLVVVGKQSFLHAALALIGARNVYEDARDHYPRPSLEDAVHRDPDVIVVLALGEDTRPFQAMAASWLRFPAMKAVRNHRVRVLRSDALLRPTLRLLEGLSWLERAVYGQG